MANRTRNDHWAEKAKAMGYPARSIFKLEEILDKNKIIYPAMKILDLGAAPGSWSLYLAKKKQCSVIACDLKPLAVKHPLITAFEGSFLDDDITLQLSRLGPYDAVVCDAAPSTSGDRDVDCARSHELVRVAIDLATKYLKRSGHFIVKVFQNGDEKELLEKLKLLYEDVKITKPKAVRKESFECYFIALRYR